MKKLLLVLFVLILTSCVTHDVLVKPAPLYLEKYLLIEKIGDRTVSIGNAEMSFDNFKKDIAKICKASGSNEILFGLNTEFQVGDLLDFLPVIKSFNGQTYFTNNKKEIKSINFN